MQLLEDPETSIDIEAKMATCTAETLNGKTTNRLVEEINNKLVNDNKENVENVIANEDSTSSDIDETKNKSDSTLEQTALSNGNDLIEIVENIPNLEINKENVTDNITAEISGNNLGEIRTKLDNLSDNQPQVVTLDPAINLETQIHNTSEELASETEECKRLSVTQDTKESDIPFSEDKDVEDIIIKNNGVMESTATQDDAFDKSNENIISPNSLTMNNNTNEKENDMGLQLENQDSSLKISTVAEAVKDLSDTQLEQDNTPIDVSDDISLTKQTEKCNKILNTENIPDDEFRPDDKPSQETVTEGNISKESGSTIEENNLCNKTIEVVKTKVDVISIEEHNTEAQETDNIKDVTNNPNSKLINNSKTVVKNLEMEEKINDDKLHESVDMKDKNESKTEENNSILDLNLSEVEEESIESQKIQCDSNKPQNDKEAETLTTVEPKDNDEPFSSKLKEMLTRPSSRIKLSNSMNILSDDDDEDIPRQEDPKPLPPPSEQKCFDLDEDDDCMLIDEDTSEQKSQKTDDKQVEKTKFTNDRDSDILKENLTNALEVANNSTTKDDSLIEAAPNKKDMSPIVSEKESEKVVEKKKEKPLIPQSFLQNCKRKLSDMTRDDLEEFCVSKIAEAVIDRTNLSDIKTKLKVMNQNIEEYKKKALLIYRQNRDLQVVLKSVQEEQKKKTNGPITPLKITRSVGMQVVMVDIPVRRKTYSAAQAPTNNTSSPSPSKVQRNNTIISHRQSAAPSNQIPVPRLVPAQSFTKAAVVPNSQIPTANNISNGAKTSPSIVQKAEKRSISRQQSTQSDTVDLTDDEPPAKTNRTATANMPVRLVQQQSLMTPRPPNIPQTINNQRKVYIPISSNHAEGLKVGQKIMLRGIRPPDPVPISPSPQVRPPTKVMRVQNTPQRLPRPNQGLKHPAPLPDPPKQYQPPNWKAVPPAPDLKLSKVENGIVISWKIDGYLENKMEEIASYQLYAYQETGALPTPQLWKKIGDVKALPLPMACTLTQFMSGFKYYFAVRAVDVKSRVGPFSVPGSIMLVNHALAKK